MAKAPLMVRPELLSRNLAGNIYIVTGANSGIGFVTAKQLAKQGATVIMACRRIIDGERAAREISNDHPKGKPEVMKLDLGSLASVRAFAALFQQRYNRLDGLVNNAGVMNTPKGWTRDGFETQFGVNYLGAFLLTALLTNLLKASAPSRVVNVSSSYHEQAMGRVGSIHFDDLNYIRRRFDSWEAYAQSKLANLMHAREFARRLDGTGVTAVSLNPGFVRTNLVKLPVPPSAAKILTFILTPVLRLGGMIEPWEGAQTTLHALLAPEIVNQNGAYFSQIGLYKDKASRRGGWPMRSPNPAAYDDDVARRLWDVSETLVGLA
ncbi:SDR family oxidoreductase [Rhizobium sp. 007]|uniref:SDR family oxidoreductase n=1 Tax=Rhizobium sp. 007 TaxID=2785056 RepID=UPI00188FAE69|nr:SDR family oxidoreductase [Rhizobium sp. 007]QPB22298.1 SDR family oxidoreductase [Rhizobium sp. 007]